MKNLWKFLGITALAAALLPYRVNKDDETGDLTLEALLWQGKKSVRDGEKHINVNLAPWFSPNRTDDLDSLELTDEPADDVLDEDIEDVCDPGEEAGSAAEAAAEVAVDVAVDVEKDEADPAQA